MNEDRSSGATVVGCEAELELIRAALLVEQPSLAAVLVEGEPGSGKTTLFGAILEELRRAGHRVLAAAPSENEVLLQRSALTDLLAPALDDIGGRSPHARAALELSLRAISHPAHEPDVAESFAVLDALRLLAAEPLVIAIDDAHWLDAASSRALEYTLRRVGDLPVRLLVTRRPGPTAAPLGLDRMAGDAVLTVRLPPLGPDELDALLRARLGLALTRPLLLELARTTDGNPLFALELGPVLARRDAGRLPASLSEALAERVRRLPRATRRALLVAAAGVARGVEDVERAIDDPDALESAIARGLLALDGPRVTFSHPLLASVAYERALPSERRAAHARLADVVLDPVEHALHLARASDGIDARLAAVLEDAAGGAAGLGSVTVAAEVAETAARLTPADDRASIRRRRFAAAELHEAAGDPGRAREIVQELVDELPPGPDRAPLLCWLADRIEGSIEESTALAMQALAEAGDAPALLARIYALLSAYARIAGNLELSLEHGRAAAHHAEASGDEPALAVALASVCELEALSGLPWDRSAMDRAIAIESRVDAIPVWDRPTYQLALVTLMTDDLEGARRHLSGELERARRLGSEPGVFHLLTRTAELELRSGRWAVALRVAREAHALARQGGLDLEEATAAVQLGLVLAHLGGLDEARALAAYAHGIGDRRGHLGLRVRSAGTLGFIELSDGRAREALGWLSPARAELERMGQGELSMSGVVHNEIEALVEAGRLDEADAVVAFVEAAGRPTARPWNAVVAWRGRALVRAARGDDPGAQDAIAAAVAALPTTPQPFEAARTHLAAGIVERRAKRWGPARRHLTAALEQFDRLGAARWAEHAAVALARLPGRRPGGAELTETERQVARLAAEGLSNREIAARLFVTVRTVEANLTRVYEKVGVSSRAQLSHRLPP